MDFQTEYVGSPVGTNLITVCGSTAAPRIGQVQLSCKLASLSSLAILVDTMKEKGW